MTEELLTKLIKPELLVLIPVLYLLGCAIKKSSMPDYIIPFGLGLIGIALAGLYIFATTQVWGAKDILLALFSSFTQGVLAAGASVYANQLYKQASAGQSQADVQASGYDAEGEGK